VFAYFGAPQIFHSDNGREFVNDVLRALLKKWGGSTVFVNGRPRHSQSQGCVERGNRYVQDKIAVLKHAEGFSHAECHPWVSWLPRICHSLNTEVHTTTKESPFRVMFGIDSRSDFALHGVSGIVMEEDINTQPSQVGLSACEGSFVQHADTCHVMCSGDVSDVSLYSSDNACATSAVIHLDHDYHVSVYDSSVVHSVGLIVQSVPDDVTMTSTSAVFPQIPPAQVHFSVFDSLSSAQNAGFSVQSVASDVSMPNNVTNANATTMDAVFPQIQPAQVHFSVFDNLSSAHNAGFSLQSIADDECAECAQ